MPSYSKRIIYCLFLLNCFLTKNAAAQLSVGAGYHAVYPVPFMNYEQVFQGINVRVGYQSPKRLKIISSISYFPHVEDTRGFDSEVLSISFEGQYHFIKNRNWKIYGLFGPGISLFIDKNRSGDVVDIQAYPLFSLGVGIGYELNQKIGFFGEMRVLYILPEIIFGVYYLF